MVVVPNDVLLRPLFPSYSFFVCSKLILSYNTQKPKNQKIEPVQSFPRLKCLYALLSCFIFS